MATKGDERAGASALAINKLASSTSTGRKEWASMLSGAVAGVVSRSVTAPIDRVKILYQVDSGRSFSVLKAAKSLNVINKNAGFSGLWRGNAVAVYRIAPYAAITYTAYDQYHNAIVQATAGPTITTRFCAGAAAGATATTLTYPLDLVRARLAAHWSLQPKYSGLFGGIREIVKTEGVLALYAGIRPTLLGIVPYAGISFGMFESLKSLSQVQFAIADPKDIPTVMRLVCGAVAGLTAQTMTYPLHVVRRRMQVEQVSTTAAAEGKGLGGGSVWRALLNIHRNEGMKGLFKGVTLSWIKAPVAVALSFTINDKLKQMLAPDPLQPNAPSAAAAATVTAAASQLLPDHDAGTDPVERPGLANTPPPPMDSLRVYAMAPTGSGSPGCLAAPGSSSSSSSSGGGGGSYDAPSPPPSEALPFDAAVAEGTAEQAASAATAAADPGSGSTAQLATGSAGTSSVVEKFVAGGVSGMCAKSVIAPADRVKILYQVNPKLQFTLSHAIATARKITEASGVSGLWRGHTATLIRVFPYAAITYTSYDWYQCQLVAQYGETNAAIQFSAGAAAGATAHSFTYPLDLLRARMAAHWSAEPLYTGYTGAMRDIVRTEGVPALFRGLKPTLLGIVPYAGLSFATFESLKTQVRSRLDIVSDSEIPTAVRLLCGGVAGLFAQSMTYPLDIVRRRLQVDNNRTYASMSDAFSQIVRAEGWRGLYKGLSMNWIKGPIGVGVSFTVNDFLKTQFRS